MLFERVATIATTGPARLRTIGIWCIRELGGEMAIYLVT